MLLTQGSFEGQTWMTTQIKFGTDGWRGIIAGDFTFDNVRRSKCLVVTLWTPIGLRPLPRGGHSRYARRHWLE
jgi:hypothetical protein